VGSAYGDVLSNCPCIASVSQEGGGREFPVLCSSVLSGHFREFFYSRKPLVEQMFETVQKEPARLGELP